MRFRTSDDQVNFNCAEFDGAEFNGDKSSFHVTSNPFPGETINPGLYRLGKHVEDANPYRVGHPLAQRIIAQGKARKPSPAEVTFDDSGSAKKIAVLAPLVEKSGWLSCTSLQSGTTGTPTFCLWDCSNPCVEIDGCRENHVRARPFRGVEDDLVAKRSPFARLETSFVDAGPVSPMLSAAIEGRARLI